MMTTKIVAIVCALCAPGAALAAKDCQIDPTDTSMKSLRHIEVVENVRGARRPGDVTFSFKDRAPITINANDPGPEPVHNMTGDQVKNVILTMRLHKLARIHHLQCQVEGRK